jgi:protein gp37
MENSLIEWTTHTWNGWAGCTKVSEACNHCYAETQTKQYGFVHWGTANMGGQRRIISDDKWREPMAWNATCHSTATRARVFAQSWADTWEDWNGPVVTNKAGSLSTLTLDDLRARMFTNIERTPDLDWLVLTKRPENIERMMPARWVREWPGNVWLGVTVENQRRAEERIPHLIRHRSVVRFLSVEPQLGPVDLTPWLSEIDWVICGGESGGSARPTQVEWARSIRDQCVRAGVAFFFKQWGNHAQVGSTGNLVRLRTKNERTLDGRKWDEFPIPMPRDMRERVRTGPLPQNAWERLDMIGDEP